jgi:N-acetylneuraminic acid mutarotase
MNFFPCGDGNTKIKVDEVPVNLKNIQLVSKEQPVDFRYSDVPYNPLDGFAVVLNGEIHVLGGSGGQRNHYKWNSDGNTWTQVSTLPYNFSLGAAVVLNGEIHVLGGYDGQRNHYKWNGRTWTKVSTLPYDLYNGSAVVLNNEIHIFGSYVSSYRTSHYKWNGSTWTKVSTLPKDATTKNCVVILRNKIHFLPQGYEYEWNGSTWTQVSTLPDTSDYLAVVLNDEIHIMKNANQQHYRKVGNVSWSKIRDLPHAINQGGAVVLDDGIHILFGGSDRRHYCLNVKDYLIVVKHH